MSKSNPKGGDVFIVDNSDKDWKVARYLHRGPKKDQSGRVLSDEDINHYHRIVVALNETIRLMAEIDEVIDQHGGWPDAFVTEPFETDEKEPSPPFA